MGKRSHQVPVASREITARRSVRVNALPRPKISPLELVILSAVLIIVLLFVAMPLRNYFQQRSEIVRVTASIQAKQAEKEQKLKDLETYRSPDYIREQARTRLGVIEPGTTAYRILDPQLAANPSATKDEQAPIQLGPWYEVLWDSVSTPDPELTVGEGASPSEEVTEENPAETFSQLPIAPSDPN